MLRRQLAVVVLAGLMIPTLIPFPALAATPYWSLVGSACFARWYGDGVWMDTCYHKHKLINDGNGSYDYFELHMFATGASSGKAKLKDLNIYAFPASNSAPMTWHDWKPGADLNGGNCNNITVGVTYPLPISYTHQWCDTWDMTKYAAAGSFRNIYKAPLFFEPWESERDVAFDIAVRVAQGATARWNFNYSAHKA